MTFYLVHCLFRLKCVSFRKFRFQVGCYSQYTIHNTWCRSLKGLVCCSLYIPSNRNSTNTVIILDPSFPRHHIEDLSQMINSLNITLQHLNHVLAWNRKSLLKNLYITLCAIAVFFAHLNWVVCVQFRQMCVINRCANCNRLMLILSFKLHVSLWKSKWLFIGCYESNSIQITPVSVEFRIEWFRGKRIVEHAHRNCGVRAFEWTLRVG